jgi:hypothetical protein
VFPEVVNFHVTIPVHPRLNHGIVPEKSWELGAIEVW